jgi:hypothetical protein
MNEKVISKSRYYEPYVLAVFVLMATSCGLVVRESAQIVQTSHGGLSGK